MVKALPKVGFIGIFFFSSGVFSKGATGFFRFYTRMPDKIVANMVDCKVDKRMKGETVVIMTLFWDELPLRSVNAGRDCGSDRGSTVTTP